MSPIACIFSKFPIILWNIVLALSFCLLSFLFPCPFFLFLLFCRRARCFHDIFSPSGHIYFPIYRPLYSCFMNLGIQGQATLPRHSDINLQFWKIPQFVTIRVKTYFFIQKITTWRLTSIEHCLNSGPMLSKPCCAFIKVKVQFFISIYLWGDDIVS